MTLPFVTVLEALKAELVDAHAGNLVNGRPVTVRHHRHREASDAEWPAISLRYVSNDVSQLSRQTTGDGLPELVMELAVDLVIDVELPPDEPDDADDGADATGYGTHAQILVTTFDALFPGQDAEPITLGGTTWDIRYDGTGNDEANAGTESARLEERLTLFYRVRADRPTILLRS